MDTAEPLPIKTSKNWRECLPDDAGDVNDISDEAVWALSSCKVEGFGITQLLDERTDLYWQSDGPQPHTITIEFQRKTEINFLLMYLDYKTDESYTPSKIYIHQGSSLYDLDEGKPVVFNEPSGWQVIDLRIGKKRPTRAFVIQVQITQNHQSGRDTHVRSIKILGPAKSHLDDNKRAVSSSLNMSRNFPNESSLKSISQFMTLR